jgi:hypothetical protein
LRVIAVSIAVHYGRRLGPVEGPGVLPRPTARVILGAALAAASPATAAPPGGQLDSHGIPLLLDHLRVGSNGLGIRPVVGIETLGEVH